MSSVTSVLNSMFVSGNLLDTFFHLGNSKYSLMTSRGRQRPGIQVLIPR